MRLLFVADGRSPIALNWMRYFIEAGHEVHLASTFACQPDYPLASLTIVPVAFSSLKMAPAESPAAPKKAGLGSAAIPLKTVARQWLGPLTLGKASTRLRKVVEDVQPELVHAMRIPYEGMAAALALRNQSNRPPLLISLWGNDFTLHAVANPWMGHYTRLALRTASALHADCRRDVRLAYTWGFPVDRPAVVLPGAGGVQRDLFFPPRPTLERPPLVINPRGFRAYVRSDTFFRSIPMVVAGQPAARFICTGMARDPRAEQWVESLRVSEYVELLPPQSRSQMAELFRLAQVSVSPSTHDGTPNTLLEAMACGCFPVAGDLESLREWITPGVNGLLVDPADPHTLAEALLLALGQPELRARAQIINDQLIDERADYSRVMQQAIKLYRRLIDISA